MLYNRNKLPGNFEVLRLLRRREGHRLVPRVPIRPDAEPVHSGAAPQERRHRPGGRVLLVRVLRQTAPSWPKLFFPIGARFSPLLITGYQVAYGAWTRCGPQRWIDSSTNGHGNLPLDGNITGC